MNNIGREMVVRRAMSHGHFDRPDFVHPQAGRGDSIKADKSCDGEN